MSRAWTDVDSGLSSCRTTRLDVDGARRSELRLRAITRRVINEQSSSLASMIVCAPFDVDLDAQHAWALVSWQQRGNLQPHCACCLTSGELRPTACCQRMAGVSRVRPARTRDCSSRRQARSDAQWHSRSASREIQSRLGLPPAPLDATEVTCARLMQHCSGDAGSRRGMHGSSGGDYRPLIQPCSC